MEPLSQFIPCMHCGQTFPRTWSWWTCTSCGFRICPACVGSHSGPMGSGFKCSRCAFGWLRQG